MVSSCFLNHSSGCLTRERAQAETYTQAGPMSRLMTASMCSQFVICDAYGFGGWKHLVGEGTFVCTQVPLTSSYIFNFKALLFLLVLLLAKEGCLSHAKTHFLTFHSWSVIRLKSGHCANPVATSGCCEK